MSPWDADGRWVDASDFPKAALAPTIYTADAQTTAFDITGITNFDAKLGVHAFLRTAMTGTNNDIDVIARVPGATTSATASTSMTGANNDMTFTAVDQGEAYNGYRIRILQPPPNNSSIVISLTGREVNISPVTNSSGAITSTSSQVQTAWGSHAVNSSVATVANSGGDTGAGVVTPYDAAVLTGGISATDIRLTLTVAGASTPLSVVVTGNDINVNVATSAGSAATSTASEVVAALNGSAAASALVTAAVAAGNDGTGVVTALSQTALLVPQGTSITADVAFQTDHGEGTWETMESFAQKTATLATEEDTFNADGDRGRWNIDLSATTTFYALSIYDVVAARD